MARSGGRKKRAGKKGRKGKPSGLMGRLRAVAGGFLFGRPVDECTSDRLQEIKGLALIGLSLWLLVAMVSHYAPYGDEGASGYNWGGQVGYYLANGAFRIAGWAGYLAGILGVAWGFVILARKEVAWPAMRLFGGLCFILSVSFMLQLGFGPELPVEGVADSPEAREAAGAPSSHVPFGPGGWLAMTLVEEVLEPKFGAAGLWILLILLSVVSFMLATEMAFYPAIAAAGTWLEEKRQERDESLVTTGVRWFGGVLRGLWDFLRGADLVDEAKAVAKTPATTKKKAAAKKAARAELESEDAGEEYEYDEDPDLESEEIEQEYENEEEEWEEDPDGEGEYEYEEYDEDEEEEPEYEYEEEEEEEDVVTPTRSKEAKEKTREVKTVTPRSLQYETPSPPAGPWTFPPLDLLIDPEAGKDIDDDYLRRQAGKLEHALHSFRVEAEVISAQVGPAVTLFELTVAQGTRMNKVTQLSQEIAAALQARSVRVIAPIPGRSTVGVEVPNKETRIVRLRELINKKAYDNKFMALPLFLGMDAEGRPVVEDMSKMPHLLIAGTTGSGKSVCINTILSSLLLTRSPHDVQMILVDPKMVELMIFKEVPHLLLPIVSDTRQATNVLNWLVEKMEGRYELMKDAGVRNIKTYNNLGEEKLKERLGENWNEERTPRHMPHIVLVIDEMADLMMVSKKEAEGTITRLAQKSRAVGIHVVVATQRPSTDVITGVLKGNLPTRIAFQVASKIDSRVILDAMGAEKLLGRGDMLYTPPGTSSLNRVQGAYLEDDELQRIVDFVAQESAPTFNQELVQTATGTGPAGNASGQSGPDDPLWGEAVRVVLQSKRGSASLLQRALSVGYTRASRLIDLMTEEGILGAHRGSKSREILVSLEDWEADQEETVSQGTQDE